MCVGFFNSKLPWILYFLERRRGILSSVSPLSARFDAYLKMGVILKSIRRGIKNMKLRSYRTEDILELTKLWNQIVEDGCYFPQDQPFTPIEAAEFFAEQTDVVCAFEETQLAGFYILHPNLTGRCSHVANASYGVAEGQRGKGIGRLLVEHSLQNARERGFSGFQFNAVVASNLAAIRLYKDLGFREVGKIQGGYRQKDGRLVDMIIFYQQLLQDNAPTDEKTV